MKIVAIKTVMTGKRPGETVNKRPRALIKVETDEGISGWGEAYSHGPDLALPHVVDYIFELIKGVDPTRIEFIMLKLFQQFRFPPGGVGLAAMSAVDHALWDISGRAAGLPVYKLLGGAARDRVKVYRSIGGPDGRAAAEQAKELNAAYGFTVFKTSPFKLSPETHRWGHVCDEAARYFEALRENTPDDWDFAFDPHAKIFSPIHALELANALAPFDPLFFEEPLRPENSDAWAKLREQMTVPLATGECLYTRFEFLDLLSKDGADIIQPDVCACGGLLEISPSSPKRSSQRWHRTTQWVRWPRP
jgi:galactonate dehydratase